MKKYEFQRGTNGFNYNFEKIMDENSEILLKMPPVSPNKRGINDIGFAAEEGIVLYATISEKPEQESAIWQEIQAHDEINKTTSYIKIKNTTDEKKRVNIRAILN